MIGDYMLPGPTIQFDTILASRVVYDKKTRRFPFSARREISIRLVESLKNSLLETGFWEPILVRADTLEGIAGNHRFLAYLALADENGLAPHQMKIPVALIDCDEATAAGIALIENEIRQDLTQWEAIRALLQNAGHKPKLAQTIFQVDDQIIQQLGFWHQLMDEQPAHHPDITHIPLTQEWFSVVNSRLSEHPQLRETFLGLLKNLDWVQSRNLAQLEQAITDALKAHGLPFTTKSAWLDSPTSACMNCWGTYQNWLDRMIEGDVSANTDAVGWLSKSCPYLRLYPTYLTHFIPQADGSKSDLTSSNGSYCQRLDRVDAYCVAPDVSEKQSCFHQHEATAKQQAQKTLRGQGLPAELPEFIKSRQKAGDFIWLAPQIEGEPCTPKTCLHAAEEPPGFVAIVQPGGAWQMACCHAECGGKAQEASRDWEAEQQREEHRQHQIALNDWRRQTVTRTLLSKQPRRLDTPETMQALEAVLVPAWDHAAMEHMLIGWQQAMRAEIAAELDDPSPESAKITRVFENRFGELAAQPTDETRARQFLALRNLLVPAQISLEAWLLCLIEMKQGNG